MVRLARSSIRGDRSSPQAVLAGSSRFKISRKIPRMRALELAGIQGLPKTHLELGHSLTREHSLMNYSLSE